VSGRIKALPISSNIAGSSTVAGMAHCSPSAIVLTAPRRILPERVFDSRAAAIAAATIQFNRLS
jgi:hypothetical protein